MKKSLLYITLASALFIGMSVQSKSNTKNIIKNSNSISLLQNVDNEKPEFVDQSIDAYLEYNTKTALYEAFGANNITDDTWMSPDKMEYAASELKDPRNGKVYNFVWNADGKSLYMIEAFYTVKNDNGVETQKQIVDFRNGIFTGMSLEKLRTWNGESFSFSGFSSTNAGTVVLCDEKCDNDKVIVRLGYDKTIKRKAMKPLSKASLNSDSNKMRSIPMYVNYIAIKA